VFSSLVYDCMFRHSDVSYGSIVELLIYITCSVEIGVNCCIEPVHYFIAEMHEMLNVSQDFSVPYS